MGLWSEGGRSWNVQIDALVCLVPGAVGWKAGLSWHTGMAEPLSLLVVSPRELFVRLRGSDNPWELRAPKTTKAEAARPS